MKKNKSARGFVKQEQLGPSGPALEEGLTAFLKNRQELMNFFNNKWWAIAMGFLAGIATGELITLVLEGLGL